jgi:hypothetical protein
MNGPGPSSFEARRIDAEFLAGVDSAEHLRTTGRRFAAAEFKHKSI